MIGYFRMATAATARRSLTTRWGTWRVWWRISTRSPRHLVSTNPPTLSANAGWVLYPVKVGSAATTTATPSRRISRNTKVKNIISQWMKKSSVSIFFWRQLIRVTLTDALDWFLYSMEPFPLFISRFLQHHLFYPWQCNCLEAFWTKAMYYLELKNFIQNSRSET